MDNTQSLAVTGQQAQLRHVILITMAAIFVLLVASATMAPVRCVQAAEIGGTGGQEAEHDGLNPIPNGATPTGRGAKSKIAAVQILLDRLGVSPGVIDGRRDSNMAMAIAGVEERTGQTSDPLNERAVNTALEQTGVAAFMSYTITAEDVGYRFVASIPEDFPQQAQLERMAFTSVPELLGERFHRTCRRIVS